MSVGATIGVALALVTPAHDAGKKLHIEPEPVVEEAAAPTPEGGSAPLESIRNCESGGDYSADTGNGYHGAYQFSQETWESVGGTGNPAEASPEEQDSRAQALYDRDGAGQWPVCGS